MREKMGHLLTKEESHILACSIGGRGYLYTLRNSNRTNYLVINYSCPNHNTASFLRPSDPLIAHQDPSISPLISGSSRVARVSSLKITCCISPFMHYVAYSTCRPDKTLVYRSQRRPFA